MYHEYENFEKALENYISSRNVYNDLIKSADSFSSVIYKDKIEILDQNIRFCY